VPDVALVSDGAIDSTGAQFGAFVVYQGSGTGIGGTSLATPTLAGLVAGMNQLRAADGLPALGELGPRLFPLIGTGALNDITTGTNGGYSAGTGYDLCTGVGSLNVTRLVADLDIYGLVPAISVDGHRSGDTVVVPAGGSTAVTVRFSASDVGVALGGIRFNVWNPPSGSTTPFAGYFNSDGGAFASVHGSSGEVDQTVNLTPGDWYFWTDAESAAGDYFSTGAWTSGYVLHVVAGSPASAAPTADAAPVAAIAVDGHSSGDTVTLPASGTSQVLVRFRASDSSANLSGIRLNIWNPPSGSTTPFAGYFNSAGGGFTAMSGSAGEVDAAITLSPGTWYFWTDGENSAGDYASTGAWTGGFVLRVLAYGSSSSASSSSTSSSSSSSPSAAPVPGISVDGHASGDSVTIPAGGSVSVVVRYTATDSSGNLSGVRYNEWNSTTGYFTNGTGGFVAPASGSAGEVDETVTLSPGTWYFWTDAENSAGAYVSTGAWTAGFVLHVSQGS
jgi:hypothetical protein